MYFLGGVGLNSVLYVLNLLLNFSLIYIVA